VGVEMLSDDVLLILFRHCLAASPRSWPKLAHVCQGWRQIIFNSPLGLDLRLHCTNGTPILKTLEYWPPLPLIVNYGGSPMTTPEDEENIIVALKQAERVASITLTITNTLLENLSTIISEPFAELEHLVLLSRKSLHLTLPKLFRWGPRLRTLHSTGVTIPALPQLLSTSTALTDLQLHEIPDVWYFPPNAFADSLSEMTQLETLSLHFVSLSLRRDYLGSPRSSDERVVLPALRFLKYRGTSDYLGSFVAQIDAPRLGHIDLMFFGQPTMDASELGRFINRVEMQRSNDRAEVVSSRGAISFRFTQRNSPTRLELRISCSRLDRQLSSMVQILDQFSYFLFRVENLNLSTTESPSGRDDVGAEQWAQLLRAFGGTKSFRVSGVHVTDILCALRPADGVHTTDTPVLPALSRLYVKKPMAMHGPSWDAVQSLVASRWLSGRPVQIYAEGYSCHICDSNFTGQQVLKTHLATTHEYRIVCSYCGDFEYLWSPSCPTLFQEHLESKHPDIARTDASISANPFRFESLFCRHGSLRAPSTTVPTTQPQ